MEWIFFLISFGILAGVYAVFTLGLNVHWGYTGLFNIGVAGFFAIGAYTSALLTTAPPSPLLFEDFIFGGNLANTLNFGFDLGFVVALVGAAAVSSFVALIVGAITLRLRDDYLAISTLGIAESVRLMFLNEKWLANGSKGLYNIPRFLGDRVSPDQYDLLYFVVVIVVLSALYLAIQRAIQVPLGPRPPCDTRGRGSNCSSRQKRLSLQAAGVHSGRRGDGHRWLALRPRLPILGSVCL